MTDEQLIAAELATVRNHKHDPAIDEPNVDQSLEPAEEWLEEPDEPPRRRGRRLLTPLPLALLAALAIAGGFIGGVLIEKGQGGSSGSGGAFAPRLAAAKGSASGSSAGAAGASAAGAGTRPGAGGFAGAGASAAGNATTGEVAYVRGDTLYVTNASGSTIAVRPAASSKVTKTVATKASKIHPGETVVVLGAQGKDGAISASSISVASSGTTGAGASAEGTTTSTTGSTSALFGSG